jgi:hypothetical protein
MELLSILDWKIDSSDVMKTIYESNDKQMAHVKTLAAQVEPGEFSRKDLIFFAYLQLIPLLLTANIHASLRTTDLLTQIQTLNIRLGWLTKWLICLTIALIVLTVGLLAATVALLKH